MADDTRIVGTAQAHEATGFADHAIYLPLVGALGEGNLDNGLERSIARAIRCEGARALENVVGIDHATMLMTGDGETASHMCDDEVALGIGRAEFPGATDGALLLIEAVHVTLAVDTGITGDAGDILELVGIGLVDGVGGLAHLLGKSMQQRRT